MLSQSVNRGVVNMYESYPIWMSVGSGGSPEESPDLIHLIGTTSSAEDALQRAGQTLLILGINKDSIAVRPIIVDHDGKMLEGVEIYSTSSLSHVGVVVIGLALISEPSSETPELESIWVDEFEEIEDGDRFLSWYDKGNRIVGSA